MTEPTDAEILELASQYWYSLDETESETEIELVRAALAKWGTPPAVAGEPVAWYEYNADLDAWFLATATTPKPRRDRLCLATPPRSPPRPCRLQGWSRCHL